MVQRHPFHIVSPSPWPFCVSLTLYCILFDLVNYLHESQEDHYECAHDLILHHLLIFILLGFISKWFIDIIIESTFEGHHTLEVQKI
jgi:cytochrome c oxidase subunit 3